MNGKPTPRKPGKHAKKFTQPTMTKQSFAQATRIDSILRKYATLGVDTNNIGLMRSQVARMPFGRADTTLDYQTAMNGVIRVQEYFNHLPSRIREKFHHDPQELVNFMADPKNIKECQELGIFENPRQSREEKLPAPPAPAAPPPPPGPAK